MINHQKLTARDLTALEHSFITPELARQAGLFRVTSPDGATLIRRNESGDYAGIVFPYMWPGEGAPREYRLRRDHPNLERRPDGSVKEKAKYLSAPGRANLFYIPPGTPPEYLTDTNIRAVFTEGEKKTLALQRYYTERGERVLVIGLAGVWNWRGTIGKAESKDGTRRDVKGVIPDFDRITWRGRKVHIVFDANVATNESVNAARRELAKELKRRASWVYLVDLPQERGCNGVDDLLAARGADYVSALIENVKQGDTDASGDAQPGRKSQSTILIELASGAEFFHTSDGEAYASVEIDGHLETWSLKSRGFRDWLVRRFYKAESKSPSSQGLQDALGVLYGWARFDGETRAVHTRVASHEGAIYVDLASDAWRVVRITAEGWSVIESADAPVRFRRPRGMLPLPEPKRGGALNDLRRFVNVKDDADWTLLLGCLVASLRPNLPTPLLALYGAQGSAKSTAARILSSLIDPAKATLRSEPRNERDLMIAARNRWWLTFDNLSHVSNSLSDSLCRLATGGGLSTRELYTDDEETLFEALRPVIINGIEDIATRGDLLSRAVVIYLPSIEAKARKKEVDLWREFELARPPICGALFDAVSTALRNVEAVKIDDLPRMADFAAWAVAAEPAFGVPAGTFVEAYRVNRATANTTVLEDSPLSEAVMKLLDAQPKPFWTGKASELLEELKSHVGEQTLRDKAWPKAANALTNKLRRLEPSLRAVGVDIREGRTGRERARILTIEKVEKASSAPSASSAGEENQQFTADDNADGLSGADDLSTGADGLENEASSAPNSQQAQEDTVTADDADGLLHDVSGITSADLEDDEIAERAAIMEVDGGLLREEAERRARMGTSRWRSTRPTHISNGDGI